jgi:hypothetical protein
MARQRANMKNRSIFPLVAMGLFATSGCDRKSPEIDKRIAALEQKNKEAAERQLELERQIEDQKLAVERDAIERERAQIEADRAELERQQGEAAVAQDEALRQREEAIARREGKLQEVQQSLEEKEDSLITRNQDLTDRDRELAGREALDFDTTEQNVPVGDYGTFYDSLSSYGSWFETSDYGYVWQPAVVREVNWRPYCRGRWVCSDRGWTWVSDEPFGWATYHYGRWALIVGRGWVWVPGTEWAPCWVSWRENDSHIGWAPLPPETMAYRGRGWGSTVDVQFGIGAGCFTFVEIRHFGSSLFRHCLPVSSNFGWYNQTTNITYIQNRNNYIICGGPRYQRLCDRIGKPLPFCRLEVDRHPHPPRDSFAMRPLIRDGKLRIAAPNMDADWNADLRPKQVRGRIETVKVERTGTLSNEITDRFRQSREDDRLRAEKSIVDLGGREHFEERRTEQLNNNRREVQGKLPKPDTREVTKNPDRPKSDGIPNRDGPNVLPPAKRNPLPGGMTRPSETTPGLAGNGGRPEVPQDKTGPRLPPTPDAKERKSTGGSADGPRVLPRDPNGNQEVAENRKQEEYRIEKGRQAEEARNAEKETSNRNQQEQAEQARKAQNEAMLRRQEEQLQQKQRQDEEARKQAMEEQREKARQQEEGRNEARRQQQEQQQRDMQRQQEEARQREQDQERQRRQDEAREQQQREQSRQREQEESRQRQQEESRQRQQEQARQQQEEQSRQQRQRDDDDQRKRNR